MNALEQINANPTLAWLSEVARAILAVALHNGAPLDIRSPDDAARLVVAEHLVRREGHSIGEALSLARSDVKDAHLRGIVRFASAIGDPTDLDRLLDGRPVRTMSRQESIETALLLFALATIHALPPPPPAQPVELDEGDHRFGPLIGRCTGCGGPTYYGHCTIAMGWPKAKPRWETVTPSAAKAPVRGSKLGMLRDGDLSVLCTTCTMRMKHAGWIPPEPPPLIVNLETSSAETARDGENASASQAVATVAAEKVGEASDTVEGDGVTVAGLIQRAKAIVDTLATVNVDRHRIDRIKEVMQLVGNDADLRYRVLAAAWADGRPPRITTRPHDLVWLDQATDVVLRGENPPKRMELT